MSEASYPRAPLESEISIQTTVQFAQGAKAATVQLEYAGFWIRALAFIIDFMLMSALFVSVVIVVAINIGVILLSEGYSSSSAAEWFYRGLAPEAVLVILFYWLYYPSQAWQATPGKRICAIHIVRVDGGRVTGRLALKRMLAYLLSSIPAGLGFLMIAWTDQKKALHDIVCGTRVVHGRL
ncbi:MAG: RDD family protein [Rhodomicrobium sp.]